MGNAAFVEGLFDLGSGYTLAHASPDGGHVGRQMISEVRAKLHRQQEVQTKSGNRLALVEQMTLRKATFVPVTPLPAAARPALEEGDVRIHWDGRDLRTESLDVVSRLEAGCKYKTLRIVGKSEPCCPPSISSSQGIDEFVNSALAKFA